MNKKFAVVSAALLSCICLASCAQECTLAELTAQASQYSLSEVREEYSGCTQKTESYWKTDSDSVILQAALKIAYGGGENGEKTTTETSTAVAVAAAADLTGVADLVNVDSDSIKYYLDGTAIKITADYEGDYELAGYSGTGSVSYEFTTYSDGRLKKGSTKTVLDGDSIGHIETSVVLTYSYTKA